MTFDTFFKKKCSELGQLFLAETVDTKMADVAPPEAPAAPPAADAVPVIPPEVPPEAPPAAPAGGDAPGMPTSRKTKPGIVSRAN